MAANGLVCFIDAIQECIALIGTRIDEEGLGDAGEKPRYTYNQLFEHVFAAHPRVNDMKEAYDEVHAKALAEGIDAQTERALLEDALAELEIRRYTGTDLSRYKTTYRDKKVVEEFLLGTEYAALALDRADADLVEVAKVVIDVMKKRVRRRTFVCSPSDKQRRSGIESCRIENALLLIANDPDFPAFARGPIFEHLSSYLKESGQGEFVDDLWNTIDTHLQDEEQVRKIGGFYEADDKRIEILSYLIAVAICQGAAVRVLSRDDESRGDATSITTAGSPAAHERRAYLMELFVDATSGEAPQNFVLDPDKVNLIGRVSVPDEAKSVKILGETVPRSRVNSIAVRFRAGKEGATVSRQHAVIAYDSASGSWLLRDADSLNGTVIMRTRGNADGGATAGSFTLDVGTDAPGTPLLSSDVIYLAPLRYDDGTVGRDPLGATFSFRIV